MPENNDSGTVKALNMIKLYDKFNRGEQVNKSELAKEFSKSEKTAYRYINDLRTLLESERNITIEYDRQKKASKHSSKTKKQTIFLWNMANISWIEYGKFPNLLKRKISSHLITKDRTEN